MPSRTVSREEIAARKVFPSFNWGRLNGMMNDTSTDEIRRDRQELIACINKLQGKDHLSEEEQMGAEYAEQLCANWQAVIERRGGGNQGGVQPYIDTELRRAAEGTEAHRRASDTNTWHDRKSGKTYRSLGYHDRVAQQPAGFQIGDFLRALVFGPKSEPEILSLSEATVGQGSALIPTRLSAEIIDNLRQAAVIFKLGARTLPMDVPVLSLAKIVTDPKAKWRAELENITTASVTFDRIDLVAKSCSFLIRCSRELAMDAVNFNSMLGSLITRVASSELDRACFAGAGSASSPSADEPLGLLSVADLQEIDLGGARLTSYDKILDVIAKILGAHADFPNAWASSPQIEIDLAKLKTATLNSPLPEPPLLSRVNNRLTTTSLSDTGVGSPYDSNGMIFGNFSECLIGIREQINVRLLSELFAGTGELGFLMHLRADLQVARPKAMGRLVGVQTI